MRGSEGGARRRGLGFEEISVGKPGKETHAGAGRSGTRVGWERGG
jgi:hypothetical protein